MPVDGDGSERACLWRLQKGERIRQLSLYGSPIAAREVLLASFWKSGKREEKGGGVDEIF